MSFLVCGSPSRGAAFVKFRYRWGLACQPSVAQWVARCAVSGCQTGRFAVPNGLFRGAKRPVSRGQTAAGPSWCASCQDALPFRASARLCCGLSPWRLQNYAIPLKWQNVAACILFCSNVRHDRCAGSLYIIYILPHDCYSLPKVSCRGRRRADTLSARRLLARFWQSQGWLRSPRRPAASKRNNN